MFDLGNHRIVNCIYPRLLNFRGMVLRLRGIFFPERVILPWKFTFKSCVIVSVIIREIGEYCRNPWENFKFSMSMAWISSLTMVQYSRLSVLMTSSSSSPSSFLTSSIFSVYCNSFTTRTDLSPLSPTRCSTRTCLGPWVHPWLFFLTSTCSAFFCSPPG